MLQTQVSPCLSERRGEREKGEEEAKVGEERK
jgi:hypothetical protein